MSIAKLKSIHGKAAFLSSEEILVGRGGLAAGGDGVATVMLPSATHAAVFDDFLSTRSAGGSDTGAAGLYFLSRKSDTGVTGGTVASSVGGVFRFQGSTTAATKTPDGTAAGLVGEQLAWKPNRGKGNDGGKLRFAARIKLTNTTTGTTGCFFGFTDTIASELPAYDTGRGGDSGASAITTASNLVGFLWGTGGDTGWRGVSARLAGGNDSGDQQVTLTSTSPVAGQYADYEVEVFTGAGDTGGVAVFYINGQPLGAIGGSLAGGRSPLQTNTLLTPCVYYYDTGGAGGLDVDWINVSMPRDSGL